MKENNQKKIAVIAVVLALLALSGSASTISSFFVSVVGQSQMNGSVTFIPGDNIVLSQDTMNKTITITSNTTGGSGGVSFNGSVVDLNGSLMHNGTFNGTFSGTFGTHDVLKVNKSGDNLSYILNLSSINNRTVVYNDINKSIHYNKITSYISSTGTEIKPTLNDEVFSYLFNLQPQNTVAGLVTFQQITNDSFPFFAGRRARGSTALNGTAYPSPLLNGDIVFRLSAAGFANNVWAGSKGIIDYVTVGNWTSTSTGMKLEFWTTASGSTVVTRRMALGDNGELTITNLAGSGNAYVCTYPNGTLYRGSPGC